jgi:hypothetical protein
MRILKRRPRPLKLLETPAVFAMWFSMGKSHRPRKHRLVRALSLATSCSSPSA